MGCFWPCRYENDNRFRISFKEKNTRKFFLIKENISNVFELIGAEYIKKKPLTLKQN